jgi:hypothetical protein
MSFSSRNLNKLEQGIQITLPVDENGLAGRECPNPDCLGYFKLKVGTGLKGEDLPCHCPYCGHVATQDHFWTQEQLAYARSIMMNEVQKALKADIKTWDRSLRRQSRNSFLKLSVEFKGRSQPIRFYREKQLETTLVCDNCTLEYAVYGVFAFCPDCGNHNSMQILDKNLELVEKEVALSKIVEDKELAERLLEDALENAISSFDGFGRAACTAISNTANNPEKAKKITFQNIQAARAHVEKQFSIDIAAGLNTEEWDFVIKCFQIRHLFAHKMSVIDDEYIRKSKDSSAVAGRKISISSEEIIKLARSLKLVGKNLIGGQT